LSGIAAFRADPLLEAVPDFIHPVTGLSAKAMLDRCSDDKGVDYYGKPKLFFKTVSLIL
jgi:hypothetical protein